MRLLGVRGQQRPSLGGCRREAGEAGGRQPLFGENQNSRRWLLVASPRRAGLLTLACRLNGDLLAAVAPASRGDGSHPQQVLLPAVQVGYSVEELLWARLVLAGSLRDGGKEGLRTQLPGLQTPTPAFLGDLGSEEGVAQSED